MWYLNIGTWIPNGREDRPDLSDHIARTFVRFEFLDDAYTHEARESVLRAEPETPAFILEQETI